MNNKTPSVLLISLIAGNAIKIFEDMGIAYIASYLRKKGCDVSIMREALASIDIESIGKKEWNFIGFSVYDLNLPDVLAAAKKLKGYHSLKKSVFFAGGYTATLDYKRLLQGGAIDYIIMGEGELTAYDSINALYKGNTLDNIPGVAYKAGKEIVVNPKRKFVEDLDSLPWPSRDLLMEKEYRVAIISSSRGCTGNCSFCVSKKYWGKWRGRSVKNTVDEMQYITQAYNINNFYIIDCSLDDPGIPSGRLESLMDEIIQRNLTIYFNAYMKADFQRDATPLLIQKMKEAGLCGLMVGIESGNQDDLNLYNKAATVEDNYGIMDLLLKHEIAVTIGFIMFNPFSTYERLLKNIEFLDHYDLAYNIEYVVSGYIVYSGNSLNDMIKKNGLWNDAGGRFYSYTMKDKRIYTFAKYLLEYLQAINSHTNDLLMRIQRYMIPFGYWSKVYEKNSLVKKILEEEKRSISVIQKELSKTIVCLFKELLELSMNGWSLEAADTVSRDIFSDDKLRNIAQQFEFTRNRMYLKMERVGIDLNKCPFL